MTEPAVSWVNRTQLILAVATFVWLMVALFFIRQSYVYYAESDLAVNQPGIWVFNISYFGIWAGLTPIIFKLCKHYPIRPLFRLKGILFHLSFLILTLALHALFAAIIIAGINTLLLNPQWSFPAVFSSLLLRFFKGMPASSLYYIAVLSSYLGLAFLETYRQTTARLMMMEHQLSQARLQALQMQLQPHFLFNALNTISAMLQTNPSRADTMLMRLSDFLRLTLVSKKSSMVPLKEELTFVRHYLEIERERFHDRLKLNIHIEPSTEELLVPFLILQPLVENAMQHGLATKPESGELTLKAMIKREQLKIVIEDNGKGVPSHQAIAEGLGLSNIRERLKQQFGASAGLILQYGEGFFLAQITMPLEFKKQESVN